MDQRRSKSIRIGSESSSLAPTSIIVDDESTWPEDLRVVFEKNLAVLTAYEEERARVDALAETDVVVRSHPPGNPHAGRRASVLDNANDLMVVAQLVGWHCTRLHPDEIAAIQRDGLHVLSRELAVDRVRARAKAGDLSPKIAARLVTENVAHEFNRRGIVWLIFTKPLLRDEHGVIRLFRSWGGESLYVGQERDPETGPVLQGIGIPCIVEVVVPVMGIESFCSVGERVMRGFLHRRNVATGHSPEMEGNVRESIVGRDVRRVIRRDDPDYELLTGCSTWRERI